jgi:hypothetical protein
MSMDGATGSGTLSAQQLLRAELPLTALGRRGIQPEAAAALRQQAAEALTSAELEVSELRGEVDRLNGFIREQWDVPRESVPAVTATGGSAVTQALEVMARAQRVADQRMADADQAETQAHYRATAAEQRVHEAQQQIAAAKEQARQLLGRADTEAASRRRRADAEARQQLLAAEQRAGGAVAAAREQYEQILIRAHGRAEQAAETATRELMECRHEEPALRAELQLRARYLRALAQVSGTTLRATLDTTRQDFDRLDGDVDPEADLPSFVISATGDVTPIQSRPAAFSAR